MSIDVRLRRALQLWYKNDVFIVDLKSLCKKYGVEYNIDSYFGDKCGMHTYEETQDFYDFEGVRLKYILQVHKSNVIANLAYLLSDYFFEHYGLDFAQSISLFFNSPEE